MPRIANGGGGPAETMEGMIEGQKVREGALRNVVLGRPGGGGEGWVGVVAAAIAGLSGRCGRLCFVFASFVVLCTRVVSTAINSVYVQCVLAVNVMKASLSKLAQPSTP